MRPDGSPPRDLGRQCHVAGIRDTFLGRGTQGEPIYLAAMDGSRVDPTCLVGLDPRTGEIRYRAAVDELTGPKAITQTDDGSVFAAGYHPGSLYRWRLSSGHVEDLGLPFEGVQFIWSLDTDSGGSVYGGTWPVGGAFRWHPDIGFAQLGPLPVAPGAEYVRTIAVDEALQVAVIGYGTPGGCLILDLDSGAEIRPFTELFSQQPFVDRVTIQNGLVAVTTETDGAVFRLHRSANGLETELLFTIPGCGPVRLTILDDQRGLVAYASPDRGAILTMDATGQETVLTESVDQGVRRVDVSPDGRSLSYLIASGAGVIDLASQEVSRVAVEPLPRAAQAISALTCGPDGRIYSGGFLNGGICATDVESGDREQLGPIGQPELLAAWGDSLVVGAYPGGWIHVIDAPSLTESTFHRGSSSSYLRDHQDRGYAFAAIDSNTAYVGFMAGYGRLPGAVVELNRDADDHVTGGEAWVMAGDRSVISLAVAAGPNGPALFGTTMVDGGMGIAPTETRAVLFRRDLATGEVHLFDPPTDSCRGLYAVTERRGRLWMFAEHELIMFDPLRDEWSTVDCALGVPRFGEGRLHAHDVCMLLHPDGLLYASVRGRGLLAIDPDSETADVLWAGEARHLAVDRGGDPYFADSATLSLLSLSPR